MLSVAITYVAKAECRYTNCRYPECHYAEWRYPECRDAENHGSSIFHYSCNIANALAYFVMVSMVKKPDL